MNPENDPLQIKQVYKLLHLVNQRNKEKVERMVNLGLPGLINMTEPDEGISALHLVSAADDLDMARLLLSLKAHPDIQDKKGQTALMLAVDLGHVQMAELLAGLGASGTLVDTKGKGLLFYCINPTKMRFLEMALDMGADINNVSYAGKSVLMFACEQLMECENICMWLLEKGADPNIADLETGRTPLMEAVKSGSVALARAILQKGVDPNTVDKTQLNAAHIAASKGLLEVLKMLSAYSADFNLTSVLGDTALHLAAAEGHAECCRFLFQRGCCVVRNLQGLLPSQIAKLNKNTAALKQLQQADKALPPGELPLFREARLHDWSFEHKAVLRQAFQSAMGVGSPVKTVSKETFVSVLQAHHAPIDDDALKSVVDVLGRITDQITIEDFFMGSKYLPKNYELSSYKSATCRSNTDKKNAKNNGHTLPIYKVPRDVSQKTDDIPLPTRKRPDTRPIRWDYLQAERSSDPASYFDEPKEVYININECVRTDDRKSLNLAFSQCVPVEVRDRYYKTPLMTACSRGNYQMARFLISKKANVNAHDQLKWTCLHHACFEGHADIVKLLLKHQAVVDAATVSGVTPLMRAILSCSPKCVALLLDAGANVEVTNKLGLSSVPLTQMSGSRQIHELINRKQSETKLSKKETPKKTSTGASPGAKESVSKITTVRRSFIVGLNPNATDYRITLPSSTIWGQRVPLYPRLQKRKDDRSRTYKDKDKLSNNP